MILRKPYAILIKNFRLIHAILTLLMGYLLYRTSLIISFINEYIGSSQTKIKEDVLSSLFGSAFFIIVAFIIVFSLIVVSVMSFKNKPIKFYLYNIFTYIYSLIIYIITFYLIQKLQYGLIDIKTLKLVQDFTTVAILFQIIALVIVIIRATGFDLKSFNFKEDLASLDIEEKDNEEFEVNLDIDTDKLIRKIRKRFRYIKYIYIENKIFINILVLIFIATISLFSYLNIDVYSKTYKKAEAFKTVQFIIGTEESYVTKYDYKGVKVKDGYELVIVRVNLKRLYYRSIKFNTGRLTLVTNNNLYYHNVEYRDELVDLGISYMNEKISKDKFNYYIMVFEVKEEDIEEEMLLRYTDITNDVVRINVIPKELNKKENASNAVLGQELNFKDSILDNTIMKIDSYELNDSFKLDYNYCTQTNCYSSAEYVSISATDNYNKTLLKLVGNIKYDETLPIIKYNNLYKFINNFVTIKYKIGDNFTSLNVTLKEVKPRKTSVENTYFIEVPNVLKDASSIILEFNVRNKVYNYTLR